MIGSGSDLCIEFILLDEFDHRLGTVGGLFQFCPWSFGPQGIPQDMCCHAIHDLGGSVSQSVMPYSMSSKEFHQLSLQWKINLGTTNVQFDDHFIMFRGGNQMFGKEVSPFLCTQWGEWFDLLFCQRCHDPGEGLESTITVKRLRQHLLCGCHGESIGCCDVLNGFQER